MCWVFSSQNTWKQSHIINAYYLLYSFTTEASSSACTFSSTWILNASTHSCCPPFTRQSSNNCTISSSYICSFTSTGCACCPIALPTGTVCCGMLVCYSFGFIQDEPFMLKRDKSFNLNFKLRAVMSSTICALVPEVFFHCEENIKRQTKKQREKTSGYPRCESHYHATIAVNQHHEID